MPPPVRPPCHKLCGVRDLSGRVSRRLSSPRWLFLRARNPPSSACSRKQPCPPPLIRGRGACKFLSFPSPAPAEPPLRRSPSSSLFLPLSFFPRTFSSAQLQGARRV